MSFLTGKPSKTTQVSENTNNPLITSTYTPVMNQGVGATNILSSLLTGQGNTGQANSAYNNYLQMAGYQPAMTQLSRSITGQGAASGLLRSGATAQALENKGAQLNNQFYNNYLQQIGSLGGMGIQAGGLVTNAGQKNTQNSTGGSPGLFGQIMSGVGSVLPFIPGI